MAGIYNFNVEQGTKYSVVLKKKDSEGTYIDYSGYNAIMPIRYDSKDGELALELSNGNGITIDTTSIKIELTPDQTELLEDRLIFYNLDLTNKSDSTDEIRFLKGNISLITEVPSQTTEGVSI